MSEEQIMWRAKTTKWSAEVESFTVVKETEKTVVHIQTWGGKPSEYRALKWSDEYRWFHVRSEAVNHALGHTKMMIERHKRQLHEWLETNKRLKEQL